MKHIILCVVCLFIPTLLYAQMQKVCLKDHCIEVEVASTQKAMAQGLSGRRSLKKDTGMLFQFAGEGTYFFWMNQMKFSLDILWLNKDGRIVFVLESLPPCSLKACPKYTSKEPAQYVLELPAGYVASHSLKLGDVLKI